MILYTFFTFPTFNLTLKKDNVPWQQEQQEQQEQEQQEQQQEQQEQQQEQQEPSPKIYLKEMS